MSIRNIAIIAHVDHGKTTLVDKMLRQAGVFRSNERVEERVMDSNPLERERGITIVSKNASVRWRDTKINLVDTPGHADFGGEVERILRMVDGVLLLVDAVEGPMPQTRFVTRKALGLGLQPVVVINKVDRPDVRAAEVHDEILELFMDLEASTNQLDAPFLYVSAKEGVASTDIDNRGTDLEPLFDAILEHVPPPRCEPDGPFQMLVSTVDHSPYVGRMAIGRIERGTVSVGQTVALLPLGEPGELSASEAVTARVTNLYGFEGIQRTEIEQAEAGDIVAMAGLADVEIGKTVTDPGRLERLAGIAVEEPTISVDFMVNNSPFAGRDGRYVTSRQVRERLFKELERNVALRVEETDKPDVLMVSGRGELHLSILMETMRREGYEFQVSRPRVITKVADDGERLEPYEDLTIDVPEDMLGTVIENVATRRGEMVDMKNTGDGRVRMRSRIPARGLFGLRGEFLTDTRGEGVMHHRFLEYGPWAGPLAGRTRGVLVADRAGVSVGFAIFNLQERATMFVSPGVAVYEGMIVGENSRPGDMEVNISKEKKLTNMRTSAADEMIRLETPREITLELALEYIEDDELIEMTPAAIRLRKRALTAIDRRRIARASGKAAV
ncbi:MAG: translational GTPase TypA [Gemmatimonadetes bacterium]|nr:translational GTPase TypA [Gemmatimonadota bacterium]